MTESAGRPEDKTMARCSKFQLHKDGNPRCANEATHTVISCPANGSNPVHTFYCADCARKEIETLSRFVRCELREGIVAREISQTERSENANRMTANRMTHDWIEGEASTQGGAL